MVETSYNDTREINDYYGLDGDRHKVDGMINSVWAFWKKTFNGDNLDKPTKEEIRVVMSNAAITRIDIEWDVSERETYHAPAFTHARKRKIILGIPLPDELSYGQTLAHELGHWFFDRKFDDFSSDIQEITKAPIEPPRNVGKYMCYAEAVAFHIEENISGDIRLEDNLTGDHLRGFRKLREIEKNNLNKDPLEILVNEYMNLMKKRPNKKDWF